MTLRLSPLYSHGMVLQRSAELIITGKCAPEAVVAVTFKGVTHSAVSDSGGCFSCSVGSYDADCRPSEMQISADGETVIIRDILIGDIWLCSGQSNMELQMGRIKHNYPDEMKVTNPLIRHFKVPQVYKFDGPRGEFDLSYIPDYAPEWVRPPVWEAYSPETAPEITAVGYFFAKKLLEYNRDVPVGLLACAVGGSPAAAWMSRGMLEGFTDEEIGETSAAPLTPAYMLETEKAHTEYINDYHRRLGEADKGFQCSWVSPGFDDSLWEDADILKPLEVNGAHWLRKTVQIPAELRGKAAVLFLGTAVDMDEVFVNGEKAGVTYYRYPPREYAFTVPDSDKMVVAVRLLVFGAASRTGGFTSGKNYFISTGNNCIDMSRGWKYALGTEFDAPRQQIFFRNFPAGLYNGMISPLLGLKLNGVIWYQGESDVGNYQSYGKKMTALIKGWRESFNIPGLPFIMTQLAYWDDDGHMDAGYSAKWLALCGQQKQTLMSLPNTGLAAANDLGEANDLHPQSKREVGERLARLALRIVYGADLPPNLFELCNCKPSLALPLEHIKTKSHEEGSYVYSD